MTMQTKQTSHERSLEDDNLAARRAAAEAIEIGRETLDTTARQSEQLARADELADRNQYILDKSERVLRGMTWSGWVANLLSRDVPVDVGGSDGDAKHSAAAGHGGGGSGSAAASAMDYSDVSEKFQPAAQAIINFRCNVQLLGQCSTDEQRMACHAICDELGDVATKALRDLNCMELDDDENETFTRLLRGMTDAENLRQALADETAVIAGRSKEEHPSLFHEPDYRCDGDGNGNQKLQSQDAHLAALSRDLSELQGIGEALNQSFTEQGDLLDSLAVKSDSLSEQTKTIRRKADRLTQRARWRSVKPEFEGYVTIRHCETGNYLTASNSTVKLQQQCHELASVFGMWKRQGDIVGLQNRMSHSWFGQTLLGYVSCSASRFGRREEWEVDDEDVGSGSGGGATEGVAILCAGANWGNGGWLEVGGKDGNTLVVGGYGAEAKKKAPLWCITILEEVKEG